MFFAVVLVIFGIVLIVRNSVLKSRKKKEMENRKLSEGETLNNPYIISHEKKIADDALYDEYEDWCKFKGEIAVDKEGFDEHRMKEYHLYKKLIKYGIKGL